MSILHRDTEILADGLLFLSPKDARFQNILSLAKIMCLAIEVELGWSSIFVLVKDNPY